MKKKLFTGYFGRHKNHPLAYAITVHVPTWASPDLRRRHLPALAPSANLLAAYKYSGMTAAQYEQEYIKELNSRPKSILKVVDNLPEGAVLLCYEKPGTFCHRHAAAKWLMKNAKVKVEELK